MNNEYILYKHIGSAFTTKLIRSEKLNLIHTKEIRSRLVDLETFNSVLLSLPDQI
jgi:hypothetical protein